MAVGAASLTVTAQIGRRIMLRRTLLGIRQGALAERVGLSQPHFSNIEKGARAIDVEKLSLIARALECRMADLLPEAEGGAPLA